jgi:hypothetical protein
LIIGRLPSLDASIGCKISSRLPVLRRLQCAFKIMELRRNEDSVARHISLRGGDDDFGVVQQEYGGVESGNDSIQSFEGIQVEGVESYMLS